MNIEKLKNIASSCIKCKSPNCSKYCKLGTNIPEILSLLEKGNEISGAKLLYDNNPFPFVTGKLCDVNRKCYGHCIKNKLNDPVEYYNVEAYLGSKYLDLLFTKPDNQKNIKVAIIGGGICGLTVAIRLIQNGIRPTIFEKNNNLGGVIINSLPDFRYNKDEIKKVIKFIEENSSVKYNMTFGDNLKVGDLDNFEFIVLSTGASIERKTLDDSINAINLLEDDNLRNKIIDKNVLVIGGGNTAMDVARSLNINNNVKIVYRRNIDNCPASKSEINSVQNENIEFIECVSPVKINKDGNNIIKSLTLEKMELYNDGGTRLNFRKTNDFIEIPCDIVVEATGSMCDYNYLNKVYPSIFNESGWIDTNESFETCINNLYVGGDLYYGPKDFNSAIYTGECIVKNILSRR